MASSRERDAGRPALAVIPAVVVLDNGPRIMIPDVLTDVVRSHSTNEMFAAHQC
ncbi:MAG: hypothetical protein ACLP0L_17600 [Solirubrobacteraceae bacterium]